MLVNIHTLLHLPVLTESSQKLGRVYDINFDIDSHCVKSYQVRSNILSKHYLIKPVQVIAITLEKIIVEDAVIDIKSSIKEKYKKSTKKTSFIPGVAITSKQEKNKYE